MSFFFLRSWSPISPCEEVLGLWDVGRRGHTRNHQPHIRAGMNHRHFLRFCLVGFFFTYMAFGDGLVLGSGDGLFMIHHPVMMMWSWDNI